MSDGFPVLPECDGKKPSSVVALDESCGVVAVADVVMDGSCGPTGEDDDTLPEYPESDSDSMATEDTVSTNNVVPPENMLNSQHVSLSDLARSLYDDMNDPHISMEERA